MLFVWALETTDWVGDVSELESDFLKVNKLNWKVIWAFH